LAGEAAADDIDLSSPWPSVEGLHIVPDREPWQDSIALPLQQEFAAVWLDFDGADRVMSE
jgi:hypothetical protein